MAILAFLDQVMGGEQAPLDVEADAIIRAYFKRNPDAAYRMTLLAMTLAGPPPVAAAPAGGALGSGGAQKPRNWLSALMDRRGLPAS